MQITEFKIEYSRVSETVKGNVPVVVVAAGSSSRMGGINKIFAPVMGIPVLARTLLAFQRNKNVGDIVVVTKAENIADVKALCDSYMITKLKTVAVGGKDRLSSVLNGMLCLDDTTKSVLIHDGARPLVSDALITAMAEKSENSDCAVCAVPLKDTLKEQGDFVKTPDRSRFVAVQTPQALNYAVYKELLESCENKECYTDDASVMEAAGYNTVIVNGEETNIKITTAIDLVVAEALLKENGECE